MFATHLSTNRSKRSMVMALPSHTYLHEKVGHATLRYKEDGDTVIRLHETDILRIHPKGGFTIDTGGWNTPTTRKRLNQFLPGTWRVYTKDGVPPLWGQGQEFQFQRKITVGPHGAVKPDRSEAAIKRDLKKVDDFMMLWLKGPVPQSFAGDPWVSYESVTADQMRDWMKTKCVFATMLVWAHRNAGMSEQQAVYLAGVSMRSQVLDGFAYKRLRKYVRKVLGV